MKRAKNRRPRQRAPRAASDSSPAPEALSAATALRERTPRAPADPSSAQLPLRPEFLHMDGRHLIWRATLRPAPGVPLRPITWDLRFRENEVTVRALHEPLDTCLPSIAQIEAELGRIEMQSQMS